MEYHLPEDHNKSQAGLPSYSSLYPSNLPPLDNPPQVKQSEPLSKTKVTTNKGEDRVNRPASAGSVTTVTGINVTRDDGYATNIDN